MNKQTSGNTQCYNLPKKYAAQAMKECNDQLYAQHCNGIFDDGDPNHPKYNNGWNYATGQFVSLFCYNQDEFMAKQYK